MATTAKKEDIQSLEFKFNKLLSTFGQLEVILIEPDDEFKERFEKKMVDFERKNRKTKNKEVSSDPLTMYEIGFLDRMISGEFNNVTVDFFELEMDKDLYKKYKKLSKKEQEKKYGEYKKKMNSLYSD